MPKYYVQSGNLSLVTTAATSRSAAVWAVHRALSPTLSFLCEESTGERVSPELDETIRVSEQGFDRPDCLVLDTLDVVTEWNQLLLAVDRLQKRLAAAE
jgi:hypothetical protein